MTIVENRRTLPPPGERHFVTILFCDLSQSTRISTYLEAEEFDSVIEAQRAVLFAAADRHGGVVVRIDGDGAAVIFGYPEAHEDDGRRAVEAALDIHAGVRDLTSGLPAVPIAVRLHSGVHAGLVLLKEGDVVRGRFEMRGDATNIAARLRDLAGPDEILASDAALGADVNFFEIEDLGPLTIRGFEDPLPAHRVVGRRPVTQRFAARAERGVAPFTGREAQLAHLQRRFREAAAGDNRLVAVVGESGLGKTRLAHELLDWAADGAWVLQAYCEGYLGARPLQPFLQVLEQVGPEARGDLDPAAIRANPADGFHALLEALTATRPAVLFIDDWQWADDASRRTLEHLRDVRGKGLLILLASRPVAAVDAGLTGAEIIDLPPLSAADAQRAAQALLPRVEPFQLERIAEASGGNPLLLEELCHTRGPEARKPAEGAGRAWLNMLIESRFANLPWEQAALLKTLAIVGPVVPTWLFDEIVGDAANEAALADLSAEDFVHFDEGADAFRFKHAVTRDVIYALNGLAERRSGHARVAEALRGRARRRGEAEPLEALSYHLAAAGDDEGAAVYAERAGEAAMAASALDRAQAQFRAALAALERSPSSPEADGAWMRVARKFASASLFDPSREQLPLLERARDRAAAAGTGRDQALAEYWLGVINYGLGECRRSIDHCDAALVLAGPVGDEKLTVEIQAALGRARAAACEYGPALEVMDAALAVKRRRASGGLDPALVYTLSCRAYLLADQGRFDDADAEFDAAMAAVGDALHQVAASVLAQRSCAFLWRGRLADALAYAGKAEDVARQVKARYLFSMTRALGAFARWCEAPGSPEALAGLAEATTWLEESDCHQYVSLNHGWLTKALAVAGDLRGARRHAHLALARAQQGDRLGEAMAGRAMAVVAARVGDLPRADRWLRRAEAAAASRQSAHETAKNALCRALIRDDRDALEAAAERAARMELTWFATTALRLMGA